MSMLLARSATKMRNYRSTRMSKLRSEVMGWMQNYEQAKTAKQRAACMESIQMNLKKYEWYGNR